MIDAITKAFSSPDFIIVCSVAAGLILVMMIIRKFFTILVTLVLICIVYAGYLTSTGQDIPSAGSAVMQEGSEHLKKIEETGEKMLKKAVRERANSALE
jgi:predicted membrane protein